MSTIRTWLAADWPRPICGVAGPRVVTSKRGPTPENSRIPALRNGFGSPAGADAPQNLILKSSDLQ